MGGSGLPSLIALGARAGPERRAFQAALVPPSVHRQQGWSVSPPVPHAPVKRSWFKNLVKRLRDWWKNRGGGGGTPMHGDEPVKWWIPGSWDNNY